MMYLDEQTKLLICYIIYGTVVGTVITERILSNRQKIKNFVYMRNIFSADYDIRKTVRNIATLENFDKVSEDKGLEFKEVDGIKLNLKFDGISTYSGTLIINDETHEIRPNTAKFAYETHMKKDEKYNKRQDKLKAKGKLPEQKSAEKELLQKLAEHQKNLPGNQKPGNSK